MHLSQPMHIQSQAELRHWLEPVKLQTSRANVQVYYGNSANEIIRYTKQFSVDHIIMCAHRSERTKKDIGSVPARVIVEAPCSVTIVRTRLNRHKA